MRSQNEVALLSEHPTIVPLSREERIRENEAFLSERFADNTKRAYLADMNAWRRFCDERGYLSHPVDPVTIVEYVRHLEESGKALKTIQRRVNGLRGASKALGSPFAPETVTMALHAIEVVRKRIMREPDARGRGKAKAFTVPELRAVSIACPATLAGVRDRFLMLLGFAIAARRHELADLLVGDLTEVEAGLEVHIRWSKVCEERHPKVPYGQHVETCPVRAWRAWSDASGVTHGRVFRSIDRHGNMGDSITPEGVGDIVTEAATRAGLGHRTAHGLRAGMATEGRRAKHDAVAIARQGGWAKHSREMLGYMQIIDDWEDNPLYGIGM
jgi:integrase